MLINKKHIALVFLLVLVAGLYWLFAPIYGFKAHQGKLPLPPFGWVELPDDTPVAHQLNNADYADAAASAIEILLNHRQAIAAPALSAAVAIDNELVWAGAVGWSDIAGREPIKTSSRFRIGSTSKAITATLFARLYERGLVSLDAPIGDYISPLPNESWSGMTLRHLASHQSGLPHYKENTDWVGRYQSVALSSHFDDVRDAVSVFDESDLLFSPGTAFHYSTLGTVLLAAALSHASDTAYRQLVNDEVVVPLGLKSIAVAPLTANDDPELATSYYVEGQRYRRWRPVDMSHRLPGGGFVATPSDLAMLGAAWLDEQYLAVDTRRLFWTPQALADGEINHQNYALGFRWGRWEAENGITYQHANHGGVSRGAQSWLMILPEQRMVIAFNINRKTDHFADFGRVYRELFAAFEAAR